MLVGLTVSIWPFVSMHVLIYVYIYDVHVNNFTKTQSINLYYNIFLIYYTLNSKLYVQTCTSVCVCISVHHNRCYHHLQSFSRCPAGLTTLKSYIFNLILYIYPFMYIYINIYLCINVFIYALLSPN